MSLCCMISDSCPISPKLGVYAFERSDLRLPRRAQRVALQQLAIGARRFLGRRVEPVEPEAPERTHLAQLQERLLHPVFQQLGGGDLARIVALCERQVAAEEERLE